MKNKILLICVIIFVLCSKSFAMTYSEVQSYIGSKASNLMEMVNNAKVLPESKHTELVKDIVDFTESKFDLVLAGISRGSNDFTDVMYSVNSTYNILKIKINSCIKMYGGNSSSGTDNSMDKNNSTYDKKKGIGHENVGAKIWTPGDNVNDILNNNAGGPINDPGNPLQTSVVNGDTDAMIVRDFGNGWGFTAPKTFEVDNGTIYFIDAKQSVNRSDDGNEEYMEVTYKAVINDGRGESLHFNFVNNNGKSIVENVGTYDYNFTTKISRKGKYTVTK